MNGITEIGCHKVVLTRSNIRCLVVSVVKVPPPATIIKPK
jgi:hypothetical protein